MPGSLFWCRSLHLNFIYFDANWPSQNKVSRYFRWDSRRRIRALYKFFRPSFFSMSPVKLGPCFSHYDFFMSYWRSYNFSFVCDIDFIFIFLNILTYNFVLYFLILNLNFFISSNSASFLFGEFFFGLIFI